eukprot:277349-Prymnesium_polylepis.1
MLPALATALAVGYPNFRTRVPNGGSSPGGCNAWGHTNCGGGGPRWSGSTVAAWSGWTTSACTADSDGDGWSNGDELGDACCIWSSATTPDLDSTGGADTRISNPRNPASTPTISDRASHMRQSFALQAPGTTSLQAAISGSTVALSWIPAAGACSYRVKVSVNSGAFTTIYDSTATPSMDAITSTTYTITTEGSHIFSIEPVNLHSTASAATAQVHHTAAVLLPTTEVLPKVLCLHGGGESPSSFQSHPGMASLVSDLSCNSGMTHTLGSSPQDSLTP